MQRSRRIRFAAAAVAALAALAAGVALAAGGGEEKATGRWSALRPSLLQRTEVAAARVGGFIYVMGGFEKASGGRTTAAVLRYDIARNRWSRARDMPIPLNHAAATAYRGKVYVLGGYAGSTGLAGEVSDFLRYDPATNR